MSVQPRPQEYDAIVVGSGASGGWAAKRMSEAGMRVALVCAGRPLAGGDYREHVQPYELKYQARANDLIRRKRPVQKDCYACTEYNESWFWNDIEEPYPPPPATSRFPSTPACVSPAAAPTSGAGTATVFRNRISRVTPSMATAPTG